MNGVLGMNQSCVIKEAAVCKTPDLFVAEAGMCVMNGAGDCKEDSIIVKDI